MFKHYGLKQKYSANRPYIENFVFPKLSTMWKEQKLQ